MDDTSRALADNHSELDLVPGGPYQIPKREVTAELLLPGQSPKEIRMYLSETAQRHSGPERPSDLLNGAGLFIPVTDLDGRFMLIQRDSIVALTIPVADECDDAGAELDAGSEVATTHSVDLRLTDGRELSGTIRYVRPQGKRRPLDFLNDCEPFFAVRENGRVHLVNRRHVVLVLHE